MVDYKSNFIKVEYDKLKLYHKRYKSNAYPEEKKHFVDDSSMVLLDDGYLVYTIIPNNAYLISNNIPESRYFFLSSIHIYVGE